MYKIYELIGKGKLEQDGYYTTTVTTYKLKEIDDNPIGGFANSDEAMQFIKLNSSDFKSSQLTILPIIEIDFDGGIISQA